MRNKIAQYLAEKASVWSSATLSSERARLEAVADALTGAPGALLAATNHLGRYTRVTVWVRVSQFWDWACPAEINPYVEFRKKNPQLFKGAYTRKTPGASYEEIHRAVQGIQDAAVRAKCLQLLENGLRFTESHAVSGKYVVGKGSKIRALYGKTLEAAPVPYHKVRAELAKLGLKPHDLRKAFAAQLVKAGAQPHQLTKVMGWASFQTAQSYIDSNEAELAALVKRSME